MWYGLTVFTLQSEPHIKIKHTYTHIYPYMYIDIYPHTQRLTQRNTYTKRLYKYRVEVMFIV